MLLKIIMIASVILSVAGYCLGIYESILSVVIFFLIWVIGLVVLWFVSCYIVTRFVDMNKDYTEHSKLYWWYVYCIIETAAQIFRIKLHVLGREIIPKEKFMLVCNHRSIIDPLVTMGELREYKMAFVARHEVYRIPLLSRLMHRCNCYCLNRDDIKEGAKTILKAAQTIKEGRASIGLYPEGTRNRGDEMLPFMNGAFKVAKKANCPIVVATLKNTGEMHKRAPFRRTNVYLEFVEVLDRDFVTEKNTVEIGNAVRRIMEENLKTSHEV